MRSTAGDAGVVSISAAFASKGSVLVLRILLAPLGDAIFMELILTCEARLRGASVHFVDDIEFEIFGKESAFESHG